MRHHLATLYRTYLDQIVAGRKTVECRLGRPGFPPHGMVQPGDLIWLKEVSGPVRAAVSVTAVETAPLASPEVLEDVRQRWNDRVLAPPEFWTIRGPGRVATLIVLGDLCSFEPFSIQKADRRAWVPLGRPPIPGSRLHASRRN